MKKWLILSGSFAVVLVILLLLFLKSGIVSNKANPFSALPDDASVIFEFHNINDQFSELQSDSLWQNLMHYGLIQTITSEIIALDSLFSKNTETDKGFNAADIWASVHKVKSDDYEILFVIEAPGTKGNIHSLAEQTDPLAGKRTYKGTTIYEIKYPDRQTLAISFIQGLYLCSFEPFLVESAIAQIKDETSLGSSNKKIKQVRKLAAKNKDLKVYINLRHISSLLSIYLESDFSPITKSLGHFAEWIVVDYAIINKAIYLNGYAISGTDEPALLNYIDEGKIANDITAVLPFNTALFYAINTRNPGKLTENMNDESGTDTLFAKYFMNWMGNNLGFAITEPFTERYEDDCYIIVSCMDTAIAKHQLTNLSKNLFQSAEVVPDYYKSFELYQLKGFKLLESTLGLRSSMLEDPSFAIINDFVVFGNSIAGIKVLIERYIEQQTLDKDLDYLNFRKQMTDNPAFNLYINTSRIGQLLSGIASADLKAYLSKDFDKFKMLNPLGIQFSKYTSNTYLVSGIIQSLGTFQNKTNLLWKTELDTIIDMQPQIVINHIDKKKEIFVQDLNNMVYLINNGGEIIWKRELDGQITGKLYQVDFYRNNKLQYLFATRNSINLIDRKGRFVENFPLQLPAPTTGGLAIIDYDNNGKYRMFVSCENGNTYGFEKSGRPLPGWSPRRNLGLVPFPIQHFLSGTRDYLVVLNSNGKMYLLDRRGEERIDPISLNTAFNQPFMIRKKDEDVIELINADKKGKFYRVSKSGHVSIDSFSTATQDIHFYAGKILNDSLDTYLFYGNEKLAAYLETRELVFEYSLPDSLEREIFTINIPGTDHSLPGMYSKAFELIYLVSPSGSLYDDFPLRGSSAFTSTDLLSEDEIVLIVGTKDQTLTTYRLR